MTEVDRLIEKDVDLAPGVKIDQDQAGIAVAGPEKDAADPEIGGNGSVGLTAETEIGGGI